MLEDSRPISGAAAGIASALVFTVIHDVFISDIWFAAPMMLFVGALCGLCLGWSYGQLVDEPSIGSWLRYNLLYVALLMSLGVASMVIFEPVISMAALMTLNGPPSELIGRALPMTLAFTVAASAAISLRYTRSWRHYGVVFLTSMVLVLLLGLNVSVLGLVSIPRGSFYLVAEFLGLIVVLNIVFVVVFVGLERSSMVANPSTLQRKTSTKWHGQKR